MAIESREIAFSHSEVVKAMVLYSRRSSRPIPVQAQVAEFGTNAAGEAFVQLHADGLAKTYDGRVMLAALIYFCNKAKIPLPQKGAKSVEWRGQYAALIIRNYGFETPALGTVAA